MSWNQLTLALFAVSLSVGMASIGSAAYADEGVSFRDDVLPLLSDRCFHCHGPDEGSREADLRLDVAESALEDRGGYSAVTPGRAEVSEVMARITAAEDDGLHMPPAESGKKSLTAREVEVFRQWIDSGAKWERHWSFERIERPIVPTVDTKAWQENPIDRFVLTRLNQEQIEPAPEATKAAQLRRASLTLTGLPPSAEALEEFLADESPDAYEQAVDRLLASPHYGERMAYNWLDVARYADSDGYQQDENRDNWPWRDWVINAYNDNLPFDQFTIEQFAGDLLPEATADQVIATCFHRNHLTNGEGGRDPAESRVDYVLDRVNTMGTAWLGLTLGCCQCHTHKYDPITQHEYYELTAFFNSIDEDGRAGKRAKPYYDYPLPKDSPYNEKRLRPLRNSVAAAEAKVKRLESQADKRFDTWLEKTAEAVNRIDDKPIAWSHLKAVELSTSKPKLTIEQRPDGTLLVGREINPDTADFYVAAEAPIQKITALRIEALPHPSHTAGGLSRSNSGNIVLTGVEVRLRQKGKKDSLPLKLASAEADFEQPGFSAEAVIDERAESGWAVWSGNIAQPRTLLLRLEEPTEVPEDALLVVRLKHESGHKQHYIGHFRLAVTNVAKPSLDMLRAEPLVALRGEDAIKGLSPEQRGTLFRHFIDHDGEIGAARGFLALRRQELAKAEQQGSIKVMVLRERQEPRQTFVLERGVWNQHGDEVSPDIPEVLGSLPEGTKRDRLALAEWIVSRENPLTARVTVNRYWQSFFGAGLVRTPEDFGLQGERPTHPDLLDWLAAEFMESGWDIKHVHRLIATSQTFRQSSRFRSELADRDPNNRLLARGPRYRLPAPFLRDQVLAAAGLLSTRLGGAPVFPYQPKGVWYDASQGKYPYNQSHGDDLYRRSLYGFWRRNAAPPAMFDAADRRTCVVSVVRTNSPMQALNLLNDPTYVEAARALAQRAQADGGETPAEQIAWAFVQVLARQPDEREATILANQYAGFVDRYAAAPEKAEALLTVGEWPVSSDADPVRLAALTATMNVVLNLDETLNLE